MDFGGHERESLFRSEAQSLIPGFLLMMSVTDRQANTFIQGNVGK